jgi:Carboxypeptidase regulatory-like domain
MKRGAQVSLRVFSVLARRWWIAVGWVAVLGVLGGMPPMGQGQDFGLRNLQGKVLDGKDAPINGAIVYLDNSRNNDIKTFISGADGSYRFAALSDDTDYTLWAAYKGKKSPTKTISSFDTRKLVIVDLHIK